MTLFAVVLLSIGSIFIGLTASAQPERPAAPVEYKMNTPVPPGIAFPDKVGTRLGSLKFFDGFPDKATVEKIYDNLDFQRAVQGYLLAIPPVSQFANRKGFLEWGRINSTVPIFENMADARTLLLTANNTTPYTWLWLDVREPLVLEVPPKVLGLMDDMWFNWVGDVGITGADKGEGGKYLLLPPGHKGEVPKGYYVLRPGTHGNWILWRSFVVDGDPKPSVDAVKKFTKIYPLSKANNPPAVKFVNVTGKTFNTIAPADFSFWEYLNQLVQDEPTDGVNPTTLGLWASVGIQKGKPFAPDARTKEMLTEAARVGDATARAIAFKPRSPDAYIYRDRVWRVPYLGGYKFEENGARLFDGYIQFFFAASGITPAMEEKMVGRGSQYSWAVEDAKGNPLDGGKNYKLHLPPNVPVKDFWSVVVYSNQTRSMLQTDQEWPAVSSQTRGLLVNQDGSVDVYFGPKAPTGKENNWIQTIPGKGWNTLLRLYGPLEPWFDKTWKPGNIELAEAQSEEQAAPGKYKMTTEIPTSITCPDKVDTCLGTLNFFDGFPDKATAEKLHDNLDFQRAVQAYLLAIPAASQAADLNACRTLGPANGVVPIWEQLADSRSLGLTLNDNTAYSWTWLDLSKGPLVLEVPPKVLGGINDMWFRWVTDVGFTGPDKGEGGKYLLLPPGYKGEVPDGYRVVRSPTFNLWAPWRTFLEDGSPRPGVERVKKFTKIYPLADAGKSAPAPRFVDLSGKPFCTINPGDYQLWELLSQVVHEEPAESLDPIRLGFYRSIGIQKARPFAPDERMKKILTDAAAAGSATARAIAFHTRDKAAYYYANSAWQTVFLGGYRFETQPGVLNLDAYAFYYFLAIGVTPAMDEKMVGRGSQYAWACRDAKGEPLDGAKNYRLHLPPNIPIKDFWSVILYSNQTRSMIQTDQQFPSVSSQTKGLLVNQDGSVDVYFGPKAPTGKENNWVQTAPGKGWNVILRLYGPLEPWFDKTWRPGEIELME
jgi:hypothetical protein